MPDFIRYMAKLTGDRAVAAAADKVAPLFNGVSGTVMAHWDDKDISVTLPFVSESEASKTEQKLKLMASAMGRADNIGLKFEVKKDVLFITGKIHSPLPPVDDNRRTPPLHTINQKPSAAAFGQFDIGIKDPAQTYFELSPQHATLRIDYKESKANTAKIVSLIKTIIFRTL